MIPPTTAQYEALYAIAKAAGDRLATHERMVKFAGGTKCEDEYCTTFRPLVAKWRRANRKAADAA